MLIFALDIWESDRSLPKYICIIFIKIIESFVRRYEAKREEVTRGNTDIGVTKLLDKYSTSAKLLPNVCSNYELIQAYAGLFLSLGHLASDLLLGQEKQSLVFQRDSCKKYKINDYDGSLKLCLDLGLLNKTESTMRGIKQKDNFQFCHKTFQEFFAALWLSRKYNEEESEEKCNLHNSIESEADLSDKDLLIRFLCGFSPEVGADFWMGLAEGNIITCRFRHYFPVQNIILEMVKESSSCNENHGENVFFCSPHVSIDKETPDEDVSILCKMITNNCTNVKSLTVEKNIWLSSSRFHSLLSTISCATALPELCLENIPCQTNEESRCVNTLNLYKNHRLEKLELGNISLSGVVLPSEEESRLQRLYFYNLGLSHDNLVQMFTSLSSSSRLRRLELTNLSCSDHCSCCLPGLDLHKLHSLGELTLDKISISSLLLPNQEWSQLCELYLCQLELSYDNLVQLCTSMSSISGLLQLHITKILCSGHSGSYHFPVLDLHKHHRLWWLTIDTISISGLLLPSQEVSKLKTLRLHKMDWSHKSLVHLYGSFSSLSSLQDLILDNLSCSDHTNTCRLPVLDLHKHHRLTVISLDKLPIYGILLPNQAKSQLGQLFLSNIVLSHDSLVQLTTALSSLTELLWLRLANLSCSDHIGRCRLPVMGLHKHHAIEVFSLNNMSITGLILPSQEDSQILYLHLDSLVLSHDNLVQLCTTLSSLPDLENLKLTNIICSDHGESCRLAALSLHNYRLRELTLDKISLSGLILSSEEESQILELSHDNLEQLCKSLSSLTVLEVLYLDNLTCTDHSGSCRLPVLDLHKHYKLRELTMDNILISGLLLPSQEESKLSNLYLSHLVLSHDNLVQICASLQSLIGLLWLTLMNLSCSDHSGGNCRLPVLDLHRHNGLVALGLDEILISGLLIPKREELLLLEYLWLLNLVLSHDNLVQICKSLSSLSSLRKLKLTNLSCSDDGGSCCLSVLDLHKHHKLRELTLDKISISGLLLRCQEESELDNMELLNLVLSHDNLVQICKSLSSLSSLRKLKLTNLSCSDDGGSCCLSVLDLHKHHKLRELTLDKISISGLLLRCQEESELDNMELLNLVVSHDNLVHLCKSLPSLSHLSLLEITNLACRDHTGSCLLLTNNEESQLWTLSLLNLVLSHDNLEQLCTSLSSLTRLETLHLENLSCIHYTGSCRRHVLDLHKQHKLRDLTVDKLPISGLLLPNHEESELEKLELNNMLLLYDCLVQLCSLLSSLSALKRLKLTSLSCIDHGGSCGIPIFDSPKAELEYVDVDQIPVEDMLPLSGVENHNHAL